jgi:serine/threonine-protein kinase
VHRDLKPSNVLIAPGDRLKIADFGLAKLSDAPPDATRRTLTDDGMVLGTAAYMSPEQAAGGAIDPRSDLFSLGCILYEMLSGRPAFTGDSQGAIIASVLRDVPPPLTNTPRHVRALVERCLQKNPENRFRCAADLSVAIDECPCSSPGPPRARRSRFFRSQLSASGRMITSVKGWPRRSSTSSPRCPVSA